LVELENGAHLIVEIKGQAGDAAIKKAAAERWCRAVNNDGRYGNWAYHLCFGAAELKHMLDTTESVSGPLFAASH
jgi:type III restriction enzyme